MFSPTDVNLFRGELIRSSSPNIVILGVPIGDLEFCSNYISNKCASAKLLLHKLEEVGAQDAQVALVLLRLCGSFCKLAHLARATPPSLSIKALELFDIDVRHCFSQCTAVTPLMRLGCRLNSVLVVGVLGCGLYHLMLLQLTLLPFVLRTLVPSLVCISPQQLGSLTPLFHHLIGFSRELCTAASNTESLICQD